MVTGDLTHDGSDAGYGRLRRALEPLAPEVMVIPGNHDDPQRMQAHFGQGSVRWQAHRVLGDWQFILLNTACDDWAGGRVGPEQRRALEGYLASEPDRPALIALHHQPVPIAAPWLDAIGLSDGEALLESLGRHPQVRLALWGHVHQAYEAWHGAVRLLATPATSLQFMPHSRSFAEDDRPPGYRWVELRDDGEFNTGVERVG
jgi:Icc protein